jgi:hypothetical protein
LWLKFNINYHLKKGKMCVEIVTLKIKSRILEKKIVHVSHFSMRATGGTHLTLADVVRVCLRDVGTPQE